MNRSEYLETQEGQYRRRRSRRNTRQLLQVTNHEPKSKKGISQQEKVDFQRQILTQLELLGRRAYRSQVVLEIDFCSHQNNPPAVHTLVKNYLDLLQRPVEGAGIERSRLLLNDDRRVDVLIANYHLRPDSAGPEIHIRVDALRHFEEDLRLLERIRRNDFRDHSVISPDEVWEEPSHGRLEDRLSDALADLRTWERSRTVLEAQVGTPAFTAMQRMQRTRVQELYLETRQPRVQDLLTIFTPHLQINSPSALLEITSQIRGQILTPPFMLDLTHAPAKDGDTDVFKGAVVAALNDFKNSHQVLFPLLTTMGVTIFCVPPAAQASGGRQQYVDLDNLARYVIPAVHEVFQPPSDIAHAVDLAAIQDAELRRFFRTRTARLARTPETSITQYQIIRLPRTNSDPEQGLVRLALTDGHPDNSLWRNMDRILDAWERQVR